MRSGGTHSPQITRRTLLAGMAAGGVVLSASGRGRDSSDEPPTSASAPSGVPELFTACAAAAVRIREAALRDPRSYLRLGELCDDFGPRLSGSAALEAAIDWCIREMTRDGQERVRRQPVEVPRWVRGAESLRLIEPREMDLPLLGLGGSIGTPAEGITAEVLVVRDLDELKARAEEAVGRIVLFNVPMSSENERYGAGYGGAVRYRGMGARWAIDHGAVGALVRSITTRSLLTPHTGGMNYAAAPRRIPAAAITIEHAEMLARWQARGIRPRVTLKMEARNHPLSPSANAIAELRGRERPDEVVVIGGHIDSWDVGQGASDDAGGCIAAMDALRILRELDLRPRRTIRVVLFTNEENGLAGGEAYAREHADELPGHVAAIESDGGVAAPIGLGIDHRDPERRDRAGERLQGLLKLLEPLGATELGVGRSGADISPMRPAGVPLLGQLADMTHYFDIHHTHADTVEKIRPDELNANVAVMATAAYALAEIPGRIDD